MIIEISHLYSPSQISILEKFIHSQLCMIGGGGLTIEIGSNDFYIDSADLIFKDSNGIDFSVHLFPRPFYFSEIIGDDVTSIVFNDIEPAFKFPNKCNLKLVQKPIILGLKIYGIQRKRKWDYYMKLKFFQETVDSEVFDSYNTVLIYLFEFSDGQRLMIHSENGVFKCTFRNSFIDELLSTKFLETELDLSALEKFIPDTNPNVDMQIYDEKTDVNKYVLLYDIK